MFMNTDIVYHEGLTKKHDFLFIIKNFMLNDFNLEDTLQFLT